MIKLHCDKISCIKVRQLAHSVRNFFPAGEGLVGYTRLEEEKRYQRNQNVDQRVQNLGWM